MREDILFASLQCDLVLVLARSAFQSQHDLLCRLCLLHHQGGMWVIEVEVTDLLVEDGLGLTTVTRLLAVITSFSLGEKRVLALFVLGHFMWTERRGKSGD